MTDTEARDNPIPGRAVRHPPSVLLFVLGVVVFLTADLLVKSLSFDRVAPQPVLLERDADGRLAPIPRHRALELIPKVLALHLTVNKGAVFGLGQGGRWFFVAFSVIAAVFIITVFCRSAPGLPLLHLSLAAVLAGAAGNLYDRLVFGVVRDMLLLFPGVKLPFGWNWPDGSTGLYPWIFNVADVCLVVGIGVLVVLMYRHDRRTQRQKSGAD